MDATNMASEADARRVTDGGDVVAEGPRNIRDMILSAEDRGYEAVHVPMWGFDVRLKTMSGKERDAFETSLRRESPGGKVTKNMENIRARLLSLVIVDDNNERVFTKTEDVRALGDKNAAALSLLFDRACVMNGITESDVKKLEKNSDETDGDSELT